jgi:hypothetical protein
MKIQNYFLALTSLVILTILVVGCSQNGPITPGANFQGLNQSNTMGPQGNRILWGLWQLRVDLANRSVDIIPLREGAAHVNVVSMLEPKPLTYLDIDNSTLSVNMAEQTVNVDVILTHPIPSHPEYTGFDVRGIVITDGSMTPIQSDIKLKMSKPEETRLINADGYTRWWNPREFTGSGILGYSDGKLGVKNSVAKYESTLNGYKYFADGLGVDSDVLSPLVLLNRGRFSTSSTNTRHYTLAFGPGTADFMVFNYAVDGNWEKPANMPPTSIDDFPKSANSLEPFHIDITQEVNSLYYDPTLIDCPPSGGLLRLKIDVATWQGAGGISKVLVGAPGLGLDFVQPVEIGGTDHYSAHISTYQADLIPNNINTSAPDVIVIASGPGGSYTTGPDKTVIKFTGPASAQPATYAVFSPSVGQNSPPVVGKIEGPTEVVAGTANAYQVSGYHDCQDSVEHLVFAWELGDDSPPQYDDGNGNVDDIHKGGNGTISSVVFPEDGVYLVDCRVTDAGGQAGYSEMPLPVHVTLPDPPQIPPAVDLILSLHRNVFLSYECPNQGNPTDEAYIELQWDGSLATGKVDEWAIYRDDDPYDGIMAWNEIGTTPGNIWEFRNRYSGSVAYNSGASYYYMVKARSLAGNGNTESSGSTELAFLEFENAETSGVSSDQHPWIVGYGGTNGSMFRKFGTGSNCYGAYCKDGYACDPNSAYYPAYTWSVIGSQPLPILIDPILAATTHEWYIELRFGGEVTPTNECWSTGQLLSVGTVPDDPSTHNTFPTYYGYDEAPDNAWIAGNKYYPIKNWWWNNDRFDQTPGTYDDRYGWGRDEFAYGPCWARYRLNDLNPSGAARVRAAIGFGSGANADPLCRPRADEIAVIIY